MTRPDAKTSKPLVGLTTHDLNVIASQNRILIEALRSQVTDLKSDVKEATASQRSDFHLLGIALCTGFITLSGAMAFAYFRLADKIYAQTDQMNDVNTRLTDKIEEQSTSAVRIETKLNDLLQRIIPVLPPPHSSQ